MALGDEAGLLVWANYKRWPTFAIGAAIIGLFLGLILAGIFGLIAGLISGAIIGFITGIIMGPNQNAFPVQVEKWVKYGGGQPRPPVRYPARVQARSYTTPEGLPIEDVRVEYLDGTQLRKMAYFGPPVWTKDGENAVLSVIQTDRNSYLPLIWGGDDQSKLYQVTPQYYCVQRKDEHGNLKFDGEGRPVMDYPRFRVDEREITENGKTIKHRKFAVEDGKPVPDEDGEPYPMGFAKTCLWDTNIMIDLDGQTKEIPRGIAARLNNERVEFTRLWAVNAATYKVSNWWRENLPVILSFLAIVCIFGISYYTLSGITGQVHDFSQSQIALNEVTSARALEAARINAQVMGALLKVGYNVDVNVTGASPAPAPSPTPGVFTIPDFR